MTSPLEKMTDRKYLISLGVCLGADSQTNRVQGEHYFDCQQNYGIFVRPEKVTVGDFPVEAINLDEDEEM